MLNMDANLICNLVIASQDQMRNLGFCTGGENGIYHANLVSRHSPDRVRCISGGVAVNAVAAEATALVKAETLSDSRTVHVSPVENGVWTAKALPNADALITAWMDANFAAYCVRNGVATISAEGVSF